MGMEVLFDVSSETLWEDQGYQLPDDYGICGRVTPQTPLPSYVNPYPTSATCSGGSTDTNVDAIYGGVAIGSFLGGLLLAFFIARFPFRCVLFSSGNQKVLEQNTKVVQNNPLRSMKNDEL